MARHRATGCRGRHTLGHQACKPQQLAEYGRAKLNRAENGTHKCNRRLPLQWFGKAAQTALAFRSLLRCQSPQRTRRRRWQWSGTAVNLQGRGVGSSAWMCGWKMARMHGGRCAWRQAGCVQAAGGDFGAGGGVKRCKCLLLKAGYYAPTHPGVPERHGRTAARPPQLPPPQERRRSSGTSCQRATAGNSMWDRRLSRQRGRWNMLGPLLHAVALLHSLQTRRQALHAHTRSWHHVQG